MKTTVKKASETFSVLPGLVSDRGEVCGNIKIHEGAIATIVKYAATHVEGVTRITGNSFVDNLAEIVGSKKIQDRSILIRLSEDTVSIQLSINVAYGVQLPTVAANVQKRITEDVQNLTGLRVTKVNVIVREMEDPKEESDEN